MIILELIDTQWNVNTLSAVLNDIIATELIDTQWNVNDLHLPVARGGYKN